VWFSQNTTKNKEILLLKAFFSWIKYDALSFWPFKKDLSDCQICRCCEKCGWGNLRYLDKVFGNFVYNKIRENRRLKYRKMFNIGIIYLSYLRGRTSWLSHERGIFWRWITFILEHKEVKWIFCFPIWVKLKTETEKIERGLLKVAKCFAGC